MDQTKTIVKMQFGSHVYGTNLPTSDQDIKAVHVPSAADILLQRAKGSILQKTNTSTERNTAEDTDFESFSLQKFMGLLLEGQTVALNMLFTPDHWLIESSVIWERICADRQHWLHSGISAFVGYCRKQAAKYGTRGSRVATVREALTFFDDAIAKYGPTAKLKDHWPEIVTFAAGKEFASIVEGTINGNGKVLMLDVCNRKVQEFASLKDARNIYQIIFNQYGQRALAAERNEGVDWKAMLHALRVCGEAEELLLHHTITYPRPEAEFLLQVRQGSIPYAQVAEELEERMARLEYVMTVSTLPKQPDRDRAEALVREVYREAVKGAG